MADAPKMIGLHNLAHDRGGTDWDSFWMDETEAAGSSAEPDVVVYVPKAGADRLAEALQEQLAMSVRAL